MNKGYYLYKEKFKFIIDGEIIESKRISWPLSETLMTQILVSTGV